MLRPTLHASAAEQQIFHQLRHYRERRQCQRPGHK